MQHVDHWIVCLCELLQACQQIVPPAHGHVFLAERLGHPQEGGQQVGELLGELQSLLRGAAGTNRFGRISPAARQLRHGTSLIAGHR
jgi:hypothetical protein